MARRETPAGRSKTRAPAQAAAYPRAPLRRGNTSRGLFPVVRSLLFAARGLPGRGWPRAGEREACSPAWPHRLMHVSPLRPRAPGVAALLLLLVTGCAADDAEPHVRAQPLPLGGDGWLTPTCQEATAAWLRRVVAVGHAQDRAAAQQLLRGSALLRASNATSSAAAHWRGPGDATGVHADPPTPRALSRPQRLARGASVHRRAQSRSPSAAPAKAPVEFDISDPNDGPALRASLVPAEGAGAEWQQVLGWPLEVDADPCTPPTWRGISCGGGRVHTIDLTTLYGLPAYSLGAAIGNLTGLSYM